MPGYVIHLAIGQEYIKKHSITNPQQFLEGVIAPDGVKDKSLTHYGPSSSNVNLALFLDSKNIKDDYMLGYFEHLLTDYLFYNRYIDTFSKEIYNDYDKLNQLLIDKYHVILPRRVVDQVFFIDGIPTLLNYELVTQIIDEISDLDLHTIAQEVLEDPISWSTIRQLKYID